MKFIDIFRSSLIGLDIQAEGIRLVQLNKTYKGLVAKHVIQKKLPKDVFSEGKIKQWETLGHLLKALVNEFDLANQGVALSLSAKWVRMDYLDLPADLSDAEIEAEIYAQIQKDMPGLNDALHMDFYKINDPNHLSNLFFAVTRQAYLQQYVNLVNGAGLNVKVVDIDHYALIRALCFVFEWSKPGNPTYAIFHIKHDGVSFILFNHSEILFQQCYDLNPNEMVDQLEQIIAHCLVNRPESHITQIGICGNINDKKILYEHFSKIYKEKICITTSLTIMENKNINIDDFLIALGLAMREGPKW